MTGDVKHFTTVINKTVLYASECVHCRSLHPSLTFVSKATPRPTSGPNGAPL